MTRTRVLTDLVPVRQNHLGTTFSALVGLFRLDDVLRTNLIRDVLKHPNEVDGSLPNQPSHEESDQKASRRHEQSLVAIGLGLEQATPCALPYP